MPHVKANGVELFHEIRGPESAPVIVFAHSIGASLEMWDAQMAAFTGRYRCLRYDTRGHGRSSSIDQPTTIDDLADDLAALLDALGIARAHVVGLSLGGMTGQAFALRHTDRLNRLALIATSSDMPRDLYLERAAVARRDGFGSFVDTVLVPRWFTPGWAAQHPDVIAGFRGRMMAGDRAGYARCAEAIADLKLADRIAGITAPTQIIVGADDPATPVAMSEAIRARIPHAEMIVVPAAAHMVVIEQAEIVNGYLGAFLDRGFRNATAPKSPSFEDGLKNRKAVLGADYVERALAAAGDFGGEWQDFVSRVPWGEIWGDPALPWKTRSMLVLAITIALNREDEFKIHLKAAFGNGVTIDELKALVRQAAIYAGVPAANTAMRWSREVLEERSK